MVSAEFMVIGAFCLIGTAYLAIWLLAEKRRKQIKKLEEDIYNATNEKV